MKLLEIELETGAFVLERDGALDVFLPPYSEANVRRVENEHDLKNLSNAFEFTHLGVEVTDLEQAFEIARSHLVFHATLSGRDISSSTLLRQTVEGFSLTQVRDLVEEFIAAGELADISDLVTSIVRLDDSETVVRLEPEIRQLAATLHERCDQIVNETLISKALREQEIDDWTPNPLWFGPAVAQR